MSSIEVTKNRLRILQRHMKNHSSSMLQVENTSGSQAVEEIGRVLNKADCRDRSTILKIFDMARDNPELFNHNFHDATVEQKRLRTIEQMKFVAKHIGLQIEDIRDNPERYLAFADSLNFIEPSLAIKVGVHGTLFGGAILLLGTEKHHKKYMKDINEVNIAGCFALTELGHGSNARGIETTATYDKSTDEFIINSPTILSQKYWIGGSLYGTHCVAFANLIVDGTNHGVHGFVVPLRDENGEIFPTIRIKDCGHKFGLNGVDNGRIIFNNHRIPRDNLLDKLGRVTPDGKYQSEIKSPTTRFALMISALVYGRIGLAISSVGTSKLLLSIAINFSNERLQFGPPNKPEIPILDYLSHQQSLFPLLAKTYAYHFSLKRLIEHLHDNDPKKLHIFAAGMKAVTTDHLIKVANVTRQLCGGQGFLSENRIGEFLSSTHIFSTFEGDNVVLLQQLSASLLKDFRKQFKDNSGMFYFFADEVSSAIREKNPLKKRYTFKDHILSTSFHRHTLRYRKKKLVALLASQLRQLLKKKSFFDAWNDSLDLVCKLAVAHIDYVVYKEFSSQIRKLCKEEEVDRASYLLLKDIRNIYALSVIQDNFDFYLQESYLAPSKSRAVSIELKELYSKIRPHVTSLCKAFDIPSHFLPPIATGTWIKHNEF